jgi:uncharacterized protein (TIGR02996 family)
VTTEDDFQRALDADPADWQTRLVFADWLQDCNDPRAEGYRVLGATHFCPYRVSDSTGSAWTAGADDNSAHRNHPEHGRAMVTRDWYDLVRPPTRKVHDWQSANWWAYFETRRACEDSLARAFAGLPPERRVELLAAPPFIPAGKPPAPKKPRVKKKPRTKKKPAAKKPNRRKPRT